MPSSEELLSEEELKEEIKQAMHALTEGEGRVLRMYYGLDGHEPMTLEAIEAGCHVMVEKPMANSVEECIRMIRAARQKGVKVGHLRLVVVWPFIENYVRALAGKVQALVVPEINLGQVVLEVERCAAGQCKVVSVPHAGGTVHDPRTITDAIMEAVR